MRIRVVSRVVAAGIGVAALLGLGVVTSAQSAKAQEGSQQEEKKDAKPQAGKKDHPQQSQRDHAQQQGHARSPEAQQQLVYQQQQRLVQYRDHLDQQQRAAPQQSAELQRQHRTAQYAQQQQYQARMRQQQLQVQSHDGYRYDYGRDPYFTTMPTFRYSRGGRYYDTNQNGVDLLHQAVSFGYDEGRRDGMADRQDRWQFNYQSSYAYQDANYGYAGFYVDREDYNTYFREGFRRGYEDGYYSRSQYGTYVSGRGTVLGAVLATILNFQSIR